MDPIDPTAEALEKKRARRKEKKARQREQKREQKAEAAKLQVHKVSNAPESGKKNDTEREAEVENPEDYNDPETPSGDNSFG
ncbi:hypothetical protein ABFX02_10G095400 [Erythranthe guttata]